MKQIGNVFLVFQSLAVCVVCSPTLRCMSRIMDDKVESVDEKGGEIEGVGYVLQTNVLRQSFNQCLARSTKKQVVISSDFDDRKGV